MEVHDSVDDPFDGGYSATFKLELNVMEQAAVMEERRQNTLRKSSWLAHGAKARVKPKFGLTRCHGLLAGYPLRNTLELKRMAV